MCRKNASLNKRPLIRFTAVPCRYLEHIAKTSVSRYDSYISCILYLKRQQLLWFYGFWVWHCTEGICLLAVFMSASRIASKIWWHGIVIKGYKWNPETNALASSWIQYNTHAVQQCEIQPEPKLSDSEKTCSTHLLECARMTEGLQQANRVPLTAVSWEAINEPHGHDCGPDPGIRLIVYASWSACRVICVFYQPDYDSWKTDSHLFWETNCKSTI